MHPIKFFLDFDGTITTEDVVDRVLDHFADSRWRLIEKDWVEGRIGSRECLAKQMDLVQATPEELAALIGEIRIDPHFAAFLKTAQRLSVPVLILSDGFDKIIHELLKKHLQNSKGLLENLPVYCNELHWDGTRFWAKFPHEACVHGCANCKEALIRKYSSPNEQIIFVGDGCSDRFAAKCADLTFAKEDLVKFCEENKIVHRRYSDFRDIQKWLESAAVKPIYSDATNG